MKVYSTISDLNPAAIQLLHESNHEVIMRSPNLPRPSESELCELVSQYEGLIIGVREKMTERVFKNSATLKLIATLSIGTDHIDPLFFTDKSKIILNCPTSNVPSVVEYVFSAMLLNLKKLGENHSFTVGELTPKPKTYDLFAKKIGVVGVGNIGSKIIETAKVFGLMPFYWTFNPEKHGDLSRFSAQYLSLEELFEICDFIILCIPLSEKTTGLIGSELINSMKPSAKFISISRFPIFDFYELINALKKNKIGGAIIDGDFSIDQIEKIKDIENIVATSHIAGSNVDADQRMDFDLANAIVLHCDSNGKLILD